jgi:hypothetical protein
MSHNNIETIFYYKLIVKIGKIIILRGVAPVVYQVLSVRTLLPAHYQSVQTTHLHNDNFSTSLIRAIIKLQTVSLMIAPSGFNYDSAESRNQTLKIDKLEYIIFNIIRPQQYNYYY